MRISPTLLPLSLSNEIQGGGGSGKGWQMITMKQNLIRALETVCLCVSVCVFMAASFLVKRRLCYFVWSFLQDKKEQMMQNKMELCFFPSASSQCLLTFDL
jgi:hypothetical protein